MKADFTNYKSLMNKLLKIKKKETCLLTVDMQNEYLDPKVGTSPLAKTTSNDHKATHGKFGSKLLETDL